MTGSAAPHRSGTSTTCGVEAVALCRRLIDDESGQDVLEYALLAALVAIVSIPAINALQTALKTSYLSWNDGLMRCWRMPEPGAGGGC